jgi:hypothetical protein
VIAALALGLALVCGLTPAAAADAASSPEDRQRFVSVTRNLERAPLDPALKADRAWALAWLSEAPDVTVTVCATAMGDMLKSNYPYSGEIALQNMFSIGVLVIERPETADDANAQQLAGMEGALNAYRSILRDKPDAKSAALDKLLRAQSQGELPEILRKALALCSAEEAESF